MRARARWLRGVPEFILRLTGNFLEAVGRLPVPANLGTPGQRNTLATDNTGPAIFAVTHSPVLPAANQPVLVTARVSDPDGVASVTLQFRLDPAANRFRTNLVDDGTCGDVLAGDGVFSVKLPGQPAGDLLAFRLSAIDRLGATNELPLPDPVYPGDRLGRECLVRFGESPLVPGERRFGNYRLWLTKAMFDRWSRRGSAHNGPLDCTFVGDDQRVIYQAGVLYNGSLNTMLATSSPLG